MKRTTVGGAGLAATALAATALACWGPDGGSPTGPAPGPDGAGAAALELLTAPLRVEELRSADTLAARLIVMDYLLGHFVREGPSPERIWIEPSWTKPDPGGPWVQIDQGAAERVGIQARFPQARFSEPGVELFLCPPGVELHIPIGGCPIRDGGIIISFGVLDVEEDGSVTALGNVKQTNPANGRTSSCGVLVRILRSRAGVWEFDRRVLMVCA